MQDHFQDFRDDTQPIGRPGLLAGSAKWLGAVLSVAIITGTAFWTYRLGQRDAFAVPIIQALEGPAKEQPADPGGTEAAHQGLSVSEVVEGRRPQPRPTTRAATLAPAPAEPAAEDLTAAELIPVVRTQPPAQTPIPPGEGPAVSAAVPDAPTAPAAPSAAAPEPPAPGPVARRIVPAPNVASPSAEARPAPADAAPAPKPAPVEEEVAAVEEEADADPAPSDTGPTDVAPADPDAASATAPPDPAARAAADPAESMMAAVSEPPTLLARMTSNRPAPRPEGRVRPVAPALAAPASTVAAEPLPAGTDPVTEAALAPEAPAAPLPAAPRPAPATAAPLPKGTMLVQLGAFESPAVATTEWKKLVAQHGDLLGRKSPVVQRTVSSGRVFYRLRAASFEDLADARAVCAALTARGPACIPARQD